MAQAYTSFFLSSFLFFLLFFSFLLSVSHTLFLFLFLTTLFVFFISHARMVSYTMLTWVKQMRVPSTPLAAALSQLMPDSSIHASMSTVRGHK